MGVRKGGFSCLIDRIFNALGPGFATEPTFIARDRFMRPMNSHAALTAPLVLTGIVTLLLVLATCGCQLSLGDCRLLVDN